MKSLLRKASLLLVLLAAGTGPTPTSLSPAYAQAIEEPTSAVLLELGGAAGDHLSFNYDLRYPNQLGVRIGMTLDPRELDRSSVPGDAERDPDRPYSLLALGHYFVGEERVTLEMGAGPALYIEDGALLMGAVGHLGVRVQPILEQFLLRLGYGPAVSVDGYEGFVAVGVGWEV